MTFTVRAKVWRTPGKGGWHFLTLSRAASNAIRVLPRQQKSGWGSVRVKATIGASTWFTSVFPAKDGLYVLAVKASVRKAEGIADGGTVRATLTLQ